MAGSAIYDIWTGAFGDGLGGLAGGMIAAAGNTVRQRFEPPPVEQALRAALEDALLEAAEKGLMSEHEAVTAHYVAQMAAFLREPDVQSTLSILLEPRSLSLAETATLIDTLHAQFVTVTQGYTPAQIPDLDFDRYITTLFDAFYQSAETNPTLQPLIQIRLLSRLTTSVKSVLQVNRQLAESAEQIATYTQPLAEKLDALHEELRWLRQERASERLLADTDTQHAFSDLIEALNSLLRDDTETHPPYGGGLPAKPGLLIGREQALRDLKARLGIATATNMQVLTAMRGWPGVGKTTLVSALAHDPEIRAAFPDGILWASLGERPNVLAELGAWGRQLGSERVMQTTDVAKSAERLRTLLRDQRRLLIIDDIWNEEIATYFKVGGRQCATLFTTRLPRVANAIADTPTDVYVLAVLTDEKALLLLRRLAPEVVANYPAESLQLVRELEGLPLAIQVAGRLLHQEQSLGFDITALIEELREGAALIEAQAPADRVDVATQTIPTVAALLQRSTATLDEQTLDCFAFLGAFAAKPATFDLASMQDVWEVADAKPIVRTLVGRGLLEPVVASGRFQMHALLVSHARSL